MPNGQTARRAFEIPELQELREFRYEVAHQPRATRPPRVASPRPSHRGRRQPYARRRLAFGLAVIGACLGIWVAAGWVTQAPSTGFAPPSGAALAGMGVRQRIVALATSQVGYSTDPSGTYCNKFSAYWEAGGAGCPAGERAEEWCADFAAWAWRRAGVQFSYGFGPGEINAGAVSFYEWAVATGHWHPAGSGFRAAAGDVAVYGLSLGAQPSAAHVAVVVSDPAGQAGPDVINGDGDRTGFSVVETGHDQLRADTGHGGGAALAGYVSP